MSMRLFAVTLLLCAAAGAEDLENFRVEVTAGIWLPQPSGQIQARGTPVDLKNDLSLESPSREFTGRLTLKPARRHRLFLEGTPYRFHGDNTIQREVVYAGRTYAVADRVLSHAEINYVFGGYQFDFVSRPRGHAGLLAGIGWLDASGMLTSTKLGVSSAESASVPLPLAGAEFRGFPVAGRVPLSIGGEVKGMALGVYGHYIEGRATVGMGLGRYVTLLAGYGVLDGQVQRKDGSVAISPNFRGPLFQLQVRR